MMGGPRKYILHSHRSTVVSLAGSHFILILYTESIEHSANNRTACAAWWAIELVVAQNSKIHVGYTTGSTTRSHGGGPHEAG